MNDRATTFPATYDELEKAVLLDAYALGPTRVRRSVEGLSDEERRAHPIFGKWSILEIVVHVADSEVVGAARMRLVLGGDRPVLPAYDQDRWSRDLRYGEADAARLESAMDLLEALRASTLPLLSRASAGDWSRAGFHPEHGAVTLRNLLELYADHTERHIEQIVARRALLGSAIELPPLLPERLY